MTKTQDRNPIFGERLKYLRETYNLSQAELADELGVPTKYGPNVIGTWEKTKREPNFNTLGRIASFFGVTTDYLLGLEAENENMKDALLIKTQNLSEKDRAIILRIVDTFKD